MKKLILILLASSFLGCATSDPRALRAYGNMFNKLHNQSLERSRIHNQRIQNLREPTTIQQPMQMQRQPVCNSYTDLSGNVISQCY